MAKLMYEGGERRNQGLLLGLTTVNVGIALLVLGSWSLIGPMVADSAGQVIGTGLAKHARPSAMDYPFMLLWALPASAAVLALVLNRPKSSSMALAIAAYPVFLLLASAWWAVQGQNLAFVDITDGIALGATYVRDLLPF